MRRLTAVVLLAVLLTTRSGRELEGVELIQTLAVDVAGETVADGGVRLTAAGDGKEDRVYQAVGETVAEAQENLNWVGERRLELTHVTHVILGWAVAPEDVLEWEVTYRRSGYGARVWLAQEGTAQELLTRKVDELAGRLKTLEDTAGVAAPTLLEALSQLNRKGQVRLPVLRLTDGEIVFAGYEMRGGAAR